MRGIVSFHPLNLELFDRFIAPLVAGSKINPEEYLQTAIRMRENAHRAGMFIHGIEHRLENAGPPTAEKSAPVWMKLKTKLDALEHRMDELSALLTSHLDPELHLDGRPFFITEGSAVKVADIVDDYMAARSESEADGLVREQLIRLDRRLVDAVEPVEIGRPTGSLQFRQDLLGDMKQLYDLVRTARAGGDWKGADTARRRPAREILEADLAFQALQIHSRAVPFWYGRDVDGLETVCRAAGVPPPDCLVPAWRILGEACAEFPGMKEYLKPELLSRRAVGAYVAPENITDLLDFLSTAGSAIIRAAARHDAGPTCTLLLRKIKECATYAERHRFGYLEAAGIVPSHMEAESDEAD
jgi:hypothetical protein